MSSETNIFPNKPHEESFFRIWLRIICKPSGYDLTPFFSPAGELV
jgi:hypothetical protein